MTLREKIEERRKEYTEREQERSRTEQRALRMMLTVYVVSTIAAFLIIRIWG